MSNKRILKRTLNEMIYDVVDECFFVQITKEDKLEASEKLINDAADFQVGILSSINKAKGKAEFRAIFLEVEGKTGYFIDALNTLNN